MVPDFDELFKFVAWLIIAMAAVIVGLLFYIFSWTAIIILAGVCGLAFALGFIDSALEDRRRRRDRRRWRR